MAELMSIKVPPMTTRRPCNGTMVSENGNLTIFKAILSVIVHRLLLVLSTLNDKV